MSVFDYSRVGIVTMCAGYICEMQPLLTVFPFAD